MLIQNDIRREVLLEWATGVENSPFKQEDLDAVSRLVVNPINVVYIFNKYRFETYMQANTIMYPPIMGVDVSGGLKQDSSTITIIDSMTTKVLGCMNCNYISTGDLARVIHFITTNWMPNVVINVERNGGYGITVISRLLKMGIRKNLYYEIKDVVVEERQDGVHAYKEKVRKKVYGTNSDNRIRSMLIDILLERVENHKDKILSPILYNEMLGMEIKRNGKVEHSASTHDDQVFSWLLALYVWYEGVNLMERFGIRKTSIRTDEDIDEDVYGDEEGTVEIVDSFVEESEITQDANNSLEEAIKAGGTLITDFLEKRRQEEDAILKALFNTPIGERAYRQMYNIPKDADININGNGYNPGIPDSVLLGFYNDEIYTEGNTYANGMPINTFSMVDNGPGSFDDENYKYSDHFNL